MSTVAHLADRLTHRDGCEAPNVVEVIGRLNGDPGLRCATCAALWFPRLRPTGQDAEADDADPDPAGITYGRRPSLEGLLREFRETDGHDRRQSERAGTGWPTHRARRRKARRRAQLRARNQQEMTK